VLIF
jgi:ATP-binding cassette subfamily A (ABC1) protein 3